MKKKNVPKLKSSTDVFFTTLKGEEKVKRLFMDRASWEGFGDDRMATSATVRGRVYDVEIERHEEEGINPVLHQWDYRVFVNGVVISGRSCASGSLAAVSGAWDVIQAVKGYKIEISKDAGK